MSEWEPRETRCGYRVTVAAWKLERGRCIAENKGGQRCRNPILVKNLCSRHENIRSGRRSNERRQFRLEHVKGDEEKFHEMCISIGNKEISICETCDTIFKYVPQKCFCQRCIVLTPRQRKSVQLYGHNLKIHESAMGEEE